MQIYTIITHAILLLFPSSVHEPHCITIPSFHLPFDWNLQPDNIRLSPSIQALKYSLKSNISSKPFYYYTGSRLGQILHSSLRMQCSSLNQHLYRKNIVDSPNCICGLTESTTHYLFHCPRYTAQRQMYINSINVPINVTTEILLFGSLFLAVQKFVIRSKRFTP